MDIIEIPSSDSETEEIVQNVPSSRILPASISGLASRGFTGEKEPLHTSYYLSSNNGWKSNERVHRQFEPERENPRTSSAVSHSVVGSNFSLPSENFKRQNITSNEKHQQYSDQQKNDMHADKRNGVVISDDKTDYRRLPQSFMNVQPVIEIPDSEVKKAPHEVSGRERMNFGSGTGSYLNEGLQRKQIGHRPDHARHGGDDDTRSMSNHWPHFQDAGDYHLPKYDANRNPPNFFQPLPTNETSTTVNGTSGSTVANGGRRTFYLLESLGTEVADNEEVSMYMTEKPRVLPSSFTGGDKPQENDETPIYQAALQDLSQPRVEADVPEGLLAVPLLRHQRIALAWMAQKETIGPNCLGGILADDQGLGKTVSTISLIQMQGPRQLESKSSDSWPTKFEPLDLDEDDDSTSELANQEVNTDDTERERTRASVQAASCKGRPPAGTLVVCPASVLRQWARELDEKVSEKAKLKVLIYHGGSRPRDPNELARYDVVLTTYAIVSNEVPSLSPADEDEMELKNVAKYALSSDFSANKKRKKALNAGKKGKKSKKGMDDSSLDYGSGALARVLWFRVVLDEAQTIKNHKTQVARACCGLRAKRRWCLSGTPIQNTIDDLYSYFRFLRYDPYAVYKSFCVTIKNPISRNAAHGYMKLQAVLKTVMLRRTKDTLIDGQPILQLPSKSVFLKKVNFSTEERSFYSNLEADFRSQFKKYADEGTVNQNYANILLMLLRLRQACDHPLLVDGFRSHSVGTLSLKIARNLPKEMLLHLLDLLEPSAAICRLCNDPPEDAVVTMCGHVFCYQCLSDMLTGDYNSCPVEDCKDQISADSTFSRSTLVSCISDKLDNDNDTNSSGVRKDTTLQVQQSICSSSKIKAAMEVLHSVCKPKSEISLFPSERCGETEFSAESTSYSQCSAHSSRSSRLPDKVIVFSQWTSMLDLLEISLKESSIQFRRLDGTMTLASRDKAVKDFTTNPEVTAMIMSLKAGNLGLNMVAANHVVILDLWWNPTTEDQAVDRAHRIGQTRPVTVSRLTIENSVEDRILALQEKKREMVSAAFGEDKGGGSATRLTVEDLRYLFMGGSL